MKLVLTEDVAHLGRKFDEIEVSDGYGLNFLLPKRKAVRADSPEGARLLAIQKRRADSISSQQSGRADLLKSLVGKTFTVSQPANESGTLFAAVDAKVLAKLLSADESISGEILAEELKIDEEIKQLDEYKVALVNKDGEIGEITVVIEAQK